MKKKYFEIHFSWYWKPNHICRIHQGILGNFYYQKLKSKSNEVCENTLSVFKTFPQANRRVSEYTQSRKRTITTRNPISSFYLIRRKTSRVLNAFRIFWKMKEITVLNPHKIIFQYSNFPFPSSSLLSFRCIQWTKTAHHIMYNLFDQESFPLWIIFFSNMKPF